ncbi:LuxR C-terminal-related transcriptional regulator [Lentzea alba]|uniref:LuxR C-terminal-related transcriptional regulator n=1 Tax=Lentzea alba TaxID=2714351 RepID=UPI0039BF5D40
MNPAELAVRRCPTAIETTGRRWREPQLDFAVKRIGTRGVLVTGEHGVGRTWFARCLAALSGAEVHWVVATETGRSIPFGALIALLPDDLTELHPITVLNALRRKLGPKSLLVVDDAHLLDEASATTLLALAPTTTKLVVTARLDAAPDAVRALAKDGLLDEVPLKPFDRDDTAGALAEGLDGEIAPGTADLLWGWSRGNGRHLTELVQHGLLTGKLTRSGCVWVWQDDELPPVSSTQDQINGLSAEGVEAFCALVLSEPVAVDVLSEVASHKGVAEIEERGLVNGEAGTVRLAHPLLAAAAAPHLTPLRRRRLVDRLLAADPGPQRAHWLLDSGTTDPTQLVAAARAVLLDQPKLAVQLAERALAADPGPQAALVLADAHAESSSPEEAWQAHRIAAQRVRNDDDLLAVLLAQASLTVWCDRNPAKALELIENTVMCQRFHADLESAAAVVTLFSARPADALARAERVLANDPPKTAWVRATLVSAAALALADRPHEAAVAMNKLTADADLSPHYRGLAKSVALLTAETHCAPDLAFLRETHLAETNGRGAFLSEAIAHLVVAEASTGCGETARALLDQRKPDEVAVLPGLGLWASAAVAGQAALHLAAAREAEEAGSLRCMVFYLASAAELGAAAEAVHVLGDRTFEAPRTRARAIGVCARASGSGVDLRAAAEAHREAGMLAEARRFEELVKAERYDRFGLTKRELEVVRHAASGLTDRAIAQTLVLSVRTVESHLAAAYRKLSISSRQELRHNPLW